MKPHLKRSGVFFIIMGTTPSSGKGGISTALRGLLDGFKRYHIPHSFIPTHDPASKYRQFLPFLKSLPLLLSNVIFCKKSSFKTIYIFLHPGPSISLIRKYIISIIGHLLGCKIISQVHSPDTDSYLKHWLKKILLLKYYSNVNYIFVLTEWWKNRLISEGIERDKISVIPNIIDNSLDDILHNNKLPTYIKTSRVIFSMARFVEGKGIDLVINAMKYLPRNYTLVLAGDGPLKADYENLIRNEMLTERVCFCGWIDNSMKHELFELSSVFCLPSKQDSFGMVFVEAMAHGVPVVAFDNGPVPDVVPNGKVGIIIKEYEPQILADAIISIAESNEWGSTSRACKNWVNSNYSFDAVMSRIIAALEL